MYRFRMSLSHALSVLALPILLASASPARGDSVVVFNEIMYHPSTNEPALEWVELHNQMAVDVDLSGWSITGGIGFTFPEGSMIEGRGYVVVSISPADLSAATGLSNLFGPFAGRLGNNGDTLELHNKNHRLMDKVTYGVDGEWPVAPDGSGVSLAKKDEDTASGEPESWTVSARVGGSPGRRNFPLTPFEVTKSSPLRSSSAWKYEAQGKDLGTAWSHQGYDDNSWSVGQGLFQAGNVSPPLGNLETLPTLFSTGLDSNGVALSPGAADPHYLLTASAQGMPPPPSIPATVVQNHPAWLANDLVSSWIGVLNPGTVSVAAGGYNYRTTFSIEGFDQTSAVIKMNVGADNAVSNVLLNGSSLGASYVGFATLSSDFAINSNRLLAGTNTLDFVTGNYDGPGANPAGFRAKIAAQARRKLSALTSLPSGRTNYYFRATFLLDCPPQQASLRLNSIVADGAVFYLNGAEVLRLNMPTGPVSASTLALTNVPNPTYQGPFVLNNASLVTGTNVFAVQLHQGPGGSNDVLFGADLELTTTNILVPPAVSLAFNEVDSASPEDVGIEIMNYGSTNLDLGGFTLARQGSSTNQFHIFPARALEPGAFLQLNTSDLGFNPNTGDLLFLYGPGRISVLDAVVVKATPHARWPDGTGRWLHPAAVTPGASNVLAFRRDVVINEIMYHAPGILAQPAVSATNLVLGITNEWKYHAQGLDLGASWRSPDYDDTLWPAGRAVFYNTPVFMPVAKNTQLPLATNGSRVVTYYFRAPFVFSGAGGGGQLTLHPIVDDGAVYYLNGVEIFRQNMPEGDIHYTNFASGGVASPAYSGPFLVPVTNLVSGLNLMAVEVHQFTTNPIAADMAFAVEVGLAGQLKPAVPAGDSPESWIELFNRGTNEVNLAGWSLSGDIGYSFASGTTIAPSGYLVVAGDVGFMQSSYPGLTVLGPFSDNLKHGSGHVVLRDPAGNPANEVRYFNSKPWPAYAAGGGSSLELRDPFTDNSKAQAWAASLEGSRSTWNTYSYRGIASSQGGPTQWNEFVVGLLDAGECLIDDLSVVESPSGASVQMLQNGAFEAGLIAWRTLGTHSYSRAEADPDKEGNHLLHLITTGWSYHLSDHLETTLANSLAVTDGREYQVSFRAKWLAGNNRLNTRLFFNRVAKTTVLPMPTQHGTPGARNSTYATNIGPTYSALSHSPVIPLPTDSVTVSVSAGDPQGVAAISLWWSTNAGSWKTIPMLPATGAATPGYSNYAASLPAQPAGTVVQFFVRAVDGLGAASTYPSGGANSRALYRVDESKPLMAQLHQVRLIMTPADADALHAHTNVMTYDKRGLTVVYDDRQVFYDAGVHLQSSQRGRDDSYRVGFTVTFPADQRFRGNEHTMAIDRSGGWSGLGGRHDEILLWNAANHAAGGLLGLECDLLQVFAPRSVEDSTGLLRLSAFDGAYFDGQFKKGGDGSLYKLEIYYYPLTTVNGDPQAPKLPQPDNVLNVEIQDWGDDKESYRLFFLQENNADQDDYGPVVAMNKAFSLTGSGLETRINELMDVDEFMRTLAFKAFTGDADTYTAGLNHNFKFYFRPEDGKALGLLWDMDYAFAQSASSGFPGAGSPNTYKINTIPHHYRLYHNHLLDIMNRSINAAYLRPWAIRYASRLGQDWSAAVNFLIQRADYIRSTMPLTTPFVITNNGGNGFTTSNGTVLLAGTAPLGVKDIKINGVLFPVRWLNLTTWSFTIPLPNRNNYLSVQGIDNYGNPITNAVDSITVTNWGALPLRPVAINEWMAANTAPAGFPDPLDDSFGDWFELYNPNSTGANLSGFYLTDSLSTPTKFQIPAGVIIPAFGFLLVWADKQADPNGLDANGNLHVNFRLSRSGSEIGLYAPDGSEQHTVSFGPQIANVSQGLHPDGDRSGYHFMTNWTPRAANRLDAPPAPRVMGVTLDALGQVLITVSNAPNRACRLDYSGEFNTPLWIPLATNRAPAGMLVFPDSIWTDSKRFYRAVLLE